MRPNGRSPPFLAIGLFIALCVMGFNYWNLSAKNAEQANEISIINAEKLTARSAADKRIDSLSKQIESLQRDVTIARTAKETETSRLVDEKKNIQVAWFPPITKHGYFAEIMENEKYAQNTCVFEIY